MEGSDLESAEFGDLQGRIPSAVVVPFHRVAKSSYSPAFCDSWGLGFVGCESKEALDFAPSEVALSDLPSPSYGELSLEAMSDGFDPRVFQESAGPRNEDFYDIRPSALQIASESPLPFLPPFPDAHSGWLAEDAEFQSSNYDHSDTSPSVLIPFPASDCLFLDHGELVWSPFQQDEQEKHGPPTNYFQSLMQTCCGLESVNAVACEDCEWRDVPPNSSNGSELSYSLSSNELNADDEKLEKEFVNWKNAASPREPKTTLPDCKYDWHRKFATDARILNPNGHPVQLCTSCFIFRQIIHSNGFIDTKLEIHLSVLTMTSHAIIQTRISNNQEPSSSIEQQKLDFPSGNAEHIDRFLQQYFALREKEGFLICYDSMGFRHVPQKDAVHSSVEGNSENNLQCSGGSGNYESLNVRPLEGSELPRSNSDNLGTVFRPGHLNQNVILNHKVPIKEMNASTKALIPPGTKSFAAVQRERTGKMKMTDLSAYFHLPITAAAKALCICPTVLKKICRKNGMRRWPHRKIKSIDRIITTLEQSIQEGNEDELVNREIQKLKQEKERICFGYANNSNTIINNNMNNSNDINSSSSRNDGVYNDASLGDINDYNSNDFTMFKNGFSSESSLENIFNGVKGIV